jgi:hypothetical protein
MQNVAERAARLSRDKLEANPACALRRNLLEPLRFLAGGKSV